MSAPEYGCAHTRQKGGNVRKVFFGLLVAALLATSLAAQRRTAAADVKHVLLISVDGLHALDVANYVANHPNSALAELQPRRHLQQRTHASQFRFFPRSSSPGDGGSPITTGLFYDVSYDRTFFDPTNPTCAGILVTT